MKSFRRHLWLTIPATLVGAAVPAAAQVYMNETQALAALFGNSVTARREQKALSADQRRRLEASSGLHFPEASYTFFTAEQRGHVQGYALVLDEIGKSKPITFMVGMSPDGKVTDVVVMVFRESRGWEVKDRRFLRQFQGKKASDPIRIQQDILNYSGATLSSKAIARGVKRALLLLNEFYPPSARSHGPSPGTLVIPALLTPVAVDGEIALYREARFCMGTLCEMRLWSRSPETAAEAFAAGFAEIRRLDRVFSRYRDDSELARVNREAAERSVEVSAEFAKLLRFALWAWRWSGGAFDVTVGPLLDAWGIRDGRPRVLVPKELAEARSRVGSEKLRLGARGRTVRFLRPGMDLDFGGLAKGYAAVRAAQVASRDGIACGLVNLGGSSLYALAQRATQAPPASDAQSELHVGEWPVGIADPRDPAHRQAVYFVLRPGEAISTSGTYDKQFHADGRTFSHLIDPRTGLPEGCVLSSTVVSRSGLLGEVLAKHLLLSAAAGSTHRMQIGERNWVLLKAGPDNMLFRRENFPSTEVLAVLPGS